MPYQKPLFLLCLQFSGKLYIGNFGEVLEKSDIGTDGFQVSREELKMESTHQTDCHPRQRNGNRLFVTGVLATLLPDPCSLIGIPERFRMLGSERLVFHGS